jgi:hypothetical protein
MATETLILGDREKVELITEEAAFLGKKTVLEALATDMPFIDETMSNMSTNWNNTDASDQ